MDAAPAAHAHRTFARSNGLGGAALPHLVEAEARHRKTVQHIRQLKVALCSTVSSTTRHQPTTPLARGESQPSSSSPSLSSRARPPWDAPLVDSTDTAALSITSAVPAPLASSQESAPPPAPSAAKETRMSAALLQSSQQEVEQLIREKHQLQRQCIELAHLLANTPPGNVSSALTVAVPAATPESPAWSSVHDAALTVVEQVARCYPSVVQDWAVARSTNKAVPSTSKTNNISHDSATSSTTASTRGLQTNAWYESSALADAADITADGLVDSLHRLAAFIPQLASMTAVSELIVEAGPDMADNIHILEEEKRSDCLAVLSITDHLTEVSAQMRREASEKDAALRAMQQTIEDLMEEKHEWSRRARASEAALAERYTQYRQREKAWEKEVAELLQSKDDTAASADAAPAVQASPIVATVVEPKVEGTTAVETAAAAEADKWKDQLAHFQVELDAKSAALDSLQQEHSDLQLTHAALQASSQETVAAMQTHTAELERRLPSLEAELQTQADTIRTTLQMVEALTAAHRSEVATLSESHTAILQEKEAALVELQAANTRMQTELADAMTSVTRRTAELHAMTAARDAAQAALAERDQTSLADASSLLLTTSTPLRLPRPDVSGGGVDGDQEGIALDEETVDSPSKSGEGDTDGRIDSTPRCTNVRHLQQSLKRMTRERIALVRKLEHRGAALVEMETELEAAQRLVAQYEARIQVLQADAERVGASAVPESTTMLEWTKRAAGVTPIKWLLFSEVEKHGVEGTLYPAPVDLSGWLLEHREPLRFADYVVRHLSHRDQLLIDAVGPLYHVGFSLLKAEGLLGDGLYFPVIWRRFLLQLQQALDVQLVGLPLSPADSARRFYMLASTAGLFKSQRSVHDPLKAYTLILAALCMCLRPRDVDENAVPTPGVSSIGAQQTEGLLAAQMAKTSERRFSATKWRCCQVILRHVCDQGDGEDETSRQLHSTVAEGAVTPFALFTKLAMQDAAAVLPCASCSDVGAPPREVHRDSRSDESTLSPPCNLASLLSHGLLSDVLPLSRFSLLMSVLQQMVKSKAELGEGRHGVSPASEHRLFSTTVASRLVPSQHLTFVSLLLFIARYEYLLCGWHSVTTAPTAEEGREEERVFPRLSLEALGMRRDIFSSDAKENTHARTVTEDAVEALMVLDADLLPAITMCICMCRSLEHEPWLLTAYFDTRSALVEVARSEGDAKLAPTSAELCPGVPLLLDAQLRDYIQQMLTPVKFAPSVSNRVVQVPTAEYERLHRELLSLYQTNETNDTYIQELLSAVEAL